MIVAIWITFQGNSGSSIENKGTVKFVDYFFSALLKEIVSPSISIKGEFKAWRVS